MQITVFGASGKVGQQVVALALAQGIEVRAVVNRHNPFTENTHLTVVQANVHNNSEVKRAVEGSQVVICALGSWGTKEKDIVSSGVRAIIPAMEAAGVRRLITLTGAGSFWAGDQPNYFDKLSHAVLSLVAKQILFDGEEHLRLLAASQLDWTCIRSSVMTASSQETYRLQTHLVAPWATIPRLAVATCLLDQVSDQTYLRQAPIIVRP